MKYAIIGGGIVGQGIDKGAKYPATTIIDKLKDRERAPGLLNECAVVFICVPTPTLTSGAQDVSAIYDAFHYLDFKKYGGVIALKSTVLPGTTRHIATIYGFEDRVVHNPEFLCAATAARDFKNQHDIMISGQSEARTIAKELHERLLDTHPIYHESFDWETTEYAKYIHNCALPVMLSFLNEVYSTVSHDNGLKELFKPAVRMAARMGNLPRLNRVPGPDGKFGWGGGCFLKDTMAFANFSRVQREKPMPTLEGAITKNKQLRPEDYDKAT